MTLYGHACMFCVNPDSHNFQFQQLLILHTINFILKSKHNYHIISTNPQLYSLDLVKLLLTSHFLIISKECPSTNNLPHKYSSAYLNVVWMCVGVL